MAPVPKPKRKRNKHFLGEWRKHREKTQADAAEFLEVDQSTISNLENGKIPYNQDALERLSVLYGCDPGDLIEINPIAPDPPKLVYSKLRQAPPAMQKRAIEVLEALLRAG
jgi:transcriptional regulator with XRE-family HTH domain